MLFLFSLPGSSLLHFVSFISISPSYISFCLSAYLSLFVCLSVCLFVCLSVSLFYSTYVSLTSDTLFFFFLSRSISVCNSILLSYPIVQLLSHFQVFLFRLCLIHQYLSLLHLFLSVCLHAFFCLSVCLSVCRSLSFSVSISLTSNIFLFFLCLSILVYNSLFLPSGTISFCLFLV